MKNTWQMTRAELAQVFAVHYGHHGKSGGWIYDAGGKVLAHGWDAYAQKFDRFLVVGKGVDWAGSYEYLCAANHPHPNGARL